jgi:hypothetical protein
MAQFGLLAPQFGTTLCYLNVDFSRIPPVDALQSSPQAYIRAFGKQIALLDNQPDDKTKFPEKTGINGGHGSIRPK